jgi:uncharacterized protein YbjQ (UPF0145 family)
VSENRFESFFNQFFPSHDFVLPLHPEHISSNNKKRKLMMKKGILLSTTPQIEGRPILEYKGVVTGETIIGANFMKDFFAGIRDIVGGRSASYEKVLRQAKDTSMDEMAERARALGANAIVGIDIDYETIGETNSMLMVATSGTAVVI